MTTAPAVTMREALADPSLLGSALQGPSWEAWRALLIATMGEPLSEAELAIFREVTGRPEPPTSRVEEALFLIGRRGGKDRAASVLAAYLAALVDWSGVLAAGEQGLVLCIGPDQRQAKITRDYIGAVLDGSPVLAGMVANRTADTIELTNRISVEVRAASFRRLRGVTCVACIATEAAFWYDEGSANADEAILGAVRPSLATTGGPLVIITTPHARRGEVWKLFQRHHGPDGDPSILVAQGTSRRFNPTLPQRVVDRAVERDAAAAAAEFFAEFRSDVAALLSENAIQAVTAEGITELSPDQFPKAPKHAHFDAATGSGKDAAALAIACGSGKGGSALLAVRHWRPPFSPAAVAKEACELLSAYALTEVQIDRYAPGLIQELFREHQVEAKVAELDTSGHFVSLLALINSQRVKLLDDARLLGELRRLERRAGASGRDKVGHPPNSHDDVAAAAAGALVEAAREPESTSLVWGTPGWRVGGWSSARRGLPGQRRGERLIGDPFAQDNRFR